MVGTFQFSNETDPGPSEGRFTPQKPLLCVTSSSCRREVSSRDSERDPSLFPPCSWLLTSASSRSCAPSCPASGGLHAPCTCTHSLGVTTRSAGDGFSSEGAHRLALIPRSPVSVKAELLVKMQRVLVPPQTWLRKSGVGVGTLPLRHSVSSWLGGRALLSSELSIFGYLKPSRRL